jgi:hypothetical protein
MALHYVLVEILGPPEQAMELIRQIPGGEHDPQDEGGGQYLVATTNEGFLTFAIQNQGYGRVIESKLVIE